MCHYLTDYVTPNAIKALLPIDVKNDSASFNKFVAFHPLSRIVFVTSGIVLFGKGTILSKRWTQF